MAKKIIKEHLLYFPAEGTYSFVSTVLRCDLLVRLSYAIVAPLFLLGGFERLRGPGFVVASYGSPANSSTGICCGGR